MNNTLILFGTETGTAEDLAEQLGQLLSNNSIPHHIENMFDIKLEYLLSFNQIFIIISTWGEGKPPSDAENLYEELKSADADTLKEKYFSVFGLGDSSFDQFCQAGKDFEYLLTKAGATRIHDRIDADLDYEKDFKEWSQEIVNLMCQPY